jgi:hypothetical protein
MKDYNELVRQVESVVRAHVGLEENVSLMGTKKGVYIKAKHLSIFILHDIFHVPISWLSKHYNISIRHTFRLISQIHDYAKYNSLYRDECHLLVGKLKLERVAT